MAKQEVVKQSKAQEVQSWFTQKEAELQAAMPEQASAKRLARYSVMAIADNPKLQECTSLSLFRAAVALGLMNLEPNTPAGLAWLVPFRNNKRGITEVQILIGYKGLIELAFRHPNALDIYTEIVCEHDQFDFDLGTSKKIRHKWTLGQDRGSVIAVYAVYKNAKGSADFEIMTIAETEKIRMASPSAGSDAWKYHKSEMQRKCPLRRLLKRKPTAFEFTLPLAKDDEGAGLLTGQEVEGVLKDRGLSLPQDAAIDVDSESSRVPDAPTAPAPAPQASAAEVAANAEELFDDSPAAEKPAPEPKPKPRAKRKPKAPPQEVAPPPELTDEEKAAAGVKPEEAEKEPEEPPAPEPMTPLTPKPTPSAADPKVPFVATKVEGYEPEAEELAKLQECPKWIGLMCVEHGIRHDDLQDCLVAQGYLDKDSPIRNAAAKFMTPGESMPAKVAVFVQKFMNPTQE